MFFKNNKKPSEDELRKSMQKKLDLLAESEKEQLSTDISKNVNDNDHLSVKMDIKARCDLDLIISKRKSIIRPEADNLVNNYYPHKYLLGFGARAFQDIQKGLVPLGTVDFILIEKELSLHGEDVFHAPSNKKPKNMLELLESQKKIHYFYNHSNNNSALKAVFDKCAQNDTTRWYDLESGTYVSTADLTPEPFLLKLKNIKVLEHGVLLMGDTVKEHGENIDDTAQMEVNEAEILPAWFIVSKDVDINKRDSLNLANAGIKYSGFGNGPPKFLLAERDKDALSAPNKIAQLFR